MANIIIIALLIIIVYKLDNLQLNISIEKGNEEH